MIRHLERALVLGAVGVAAEVLFTAFAAPSGGPRLVGFSYVWMLPIYMLLYPGFLVLDPVLGRRPWWLRSSAYAAGIMTVELLTGLLLHALLGEAPWEPGYRQARWSVLGVVRLDYFPAWAMGALVFERAHRLLSPAKT